MDKNFTDLSLPNSVSRISKQQYGVLNWLEGSVITKYGIVDVISGENYARLDFVSHGKLYIRNINKGYSKRGLAIIAGKFAEEISGLWPHGPLL